MCKALTSVVLRRSRSTDCKAASRLAITLPCRFVPYLHYMYNETRTSRMGFELPLTWARVRFHYHRACGDLTEISSGHHLVPDTISRRNPYLRARSDCRILII